jgi:hypothetical protein
LDNDSSKFLEDHIVINKCLQLVDNYVNNKLQNTFDTRVTVLPSCAFSHFLRGLSQEALADYIGISKVISVKLNLRVLIKRIR